uniref:Uncharacterized protein n=1 Tax=Kalanchoe fedtschenkoi TaxID=63787 RepID=A0A7N0TZ95_KALFE
MGCFGWLCRVIEWLDCCCASAAVNSLDKQDELMFPVSSVFCCRDAVFQHQRTQCCDFLSQLPSSVSLDDSGIYAQVLFSNQPRWLNFFNNPDQENPSEEIHATRVLIPVPGALVELFAAKQVFEDQQVVDFVMSHCSNQLELQAFFNSGLPSSTHGAHDNGYGMEAMMTHDGSDLPREPSGGHSKDLNEKDSVKPEMGRSDSISDCSDQIDDEDDAGCRKRNGKRPQAKNLEAERRRRKKLNERLYNLRSLVPIISKLDKASILVDAITYVKDLKKQEKELQDELEELSNDEDVRNNGTANIEAPTDFMSYPDNLNAPNNLLFGAIDSMQPCTLITRTHEAATEDDKVQQMEPQVEVTLINANKFFIKVFCEHKPGRLVRLLEFLNSLGLEVTNVNVTSCKKLVSNLFEVELKRDSEVVADDLKNSLLELTRIPLSSGWMHDQIPSKPGNGVDIYQCHHGMMNHHGIPYHLQN